MTDEEKQKLEDYQKKYYVKKSKIKAILLLMCKALVSTTLIKHIINYNDGNSFNE